MPPGRTAAEKVEEAYARHAGRISADGYRFNSIYIATKALSDWRLLTSIDIIGKRILNVGCAEPIDEIQFVERVERWIAIDASGEMTASAEAVARERLSDRLLGKLEFRQADVTRLPFKDESFDIALCFSTIEHIPDSDARRRGFREMARVVRGEGHVIVTAPNRHSLFHAAHLRNMRRGTSDYGYSCLYTPLELRNELRAVGLDPLKFASEYGMFAYMPSCLPGLLRRYPLGLLQYFGERIGWLCRKPRRKGRRD